MAARRPGRQQTFRTGDFISNDNDNDSAIGEVEMNDSVPFRTGIQGLRVNFHKPETIRPGYSVDVTDTKNLIDLIDTKLLIGTEKTSRLIGASDWVTAKRAFDVLSAFLGAKVKKDELGKALNDNSSALNAFLSGKLKRLGGITSLFYSENRRLASEKPNEFQERLSAFKRVESGRIENIVEVKAIDDRLRAERKIIDAVTTTNPFTGLSEEQTLQKISVQEPPFYPRLADSEKALIWNWVRAKEQALVILHSSKSYKFASQVAGFANMPLRDLITSAFDQKGSYGQLKDFPIDAYTDPQISSERDNLAFVVSNLWDAYQASLKKDVGDQQQQVNMSAFAKNPFNRSKQKDLDAYFDNVIGEKDPQRRPKFFSSDVVTLETVDPSPETLRIKALHKTLKKTLEGDFVEESKRRMFLASDWMQRPEVLGEGQLDHRFYSAVEGAFSRVKLLGCAFAGLRDANGFIESEDAVVVTLFAELTALQLMRSDFLNPRRTRLDKTGDRILVRERRLMSVLGKFSVDDNGMVWSSSSVFETSLKKRAEYHNF